MRINLQVPFVEKDAVKALGARWDGALKVWYIKDLKDLTPFRRWMSQTGSLFDDGQSGATAKADRSPTTAKIGTGGSAMTISAPVAHCGCNVLPWLDCVHTAPKP